MIPVFIMGLPIADTLVAIARRGLRRLEHHRGGLFVADRNHIHHRLLALGVDHKNAVLILYGAGVCRVGCPPLRDPSVHDIAPTVLERLGLPLSEELSGRPLVEAFESPHVIARVPRYGAPVHTPHALPSEIDPELNEKLDALGYLD